MIVASWKSDWKSPKIFTTNLNQHKWQIKLWADGLDEKGKEFRDIKTLTTGVCYLNECIEICKNELQKMRSEDSKYLYGFTVIKLR